MTARRLSCFRMCVHYPPEDVQAKRTCSTSVSVSLTKPLCEGASCSSKDSTAAQSGVSAAVLFPVAPTSTMPLSSNHLHPSKLMKRHHQLASTAPPTGAAVPLFHPQPASALLSHFDPSSASDESEESDGLVSPPSGFYSNSGPTPQRVQVAFGADVPIMAASTVASMARDRRTSTSSTTTVVPSKAKLRKGRSPPKPSSRTLSSESSSEDSCLGGF